MSKEMQEYQYLVRNRITGSIFLKCKTFQDAQHKIDRLYESKKNYLRLLLGKEVDKEAVFDIVDLNNIPDDIH